MGGHLDDLPEQSVEKMYKAVLAITVFYVAAAMFIKLSLCAFYLRLSVDERFRLVVYIIGLICLAYGIASMLVAGFLCIPFSKIWNPTQPGSCINAAAFYYANAALNLATDVIIYTLPLRPLWKLPVPLSQRIGLTFLILLGGL